MVVPKSLKFCLLVETEPTDMRNNTVEGKAEFLDGGKIGAKSSKCQALRH
jgi:hypothetical protein